MSRRIGEGKGRGEERGEGRGEEGKGRGVGEGLGVGLWVGGLRRQLVGHEGEQTEERVQRTECVQSVWRSERSLAS